MAFGDMVAEIRGCVPKIPISFCPTLINRAWRVVRESNLWSFNLFECSWISPPLMTTGTVTATQGFPQITFDPVAIAAIQAAQIAQPYSLFTQRQFRIGVGGIYNILAFDPAFASNGIVLLDRPYGDVGGSQLAYQIYQLYYFATDNSGAPMFDFLTWLSIRNPVMFLYLELTKTRRTLDQVDPQRLWYAWPTDAVPWGIDLRGQGTINASASLGCMLFELWGQPVNPFVYQCYGVRKGVDLVGPTDTLPYQVGEDLVLAMARTYAYEWAEANKDITPRNSGPDFRFLIGKSMDEYKKLLIMYRRQDRELVDNWYSVRGIQTPIFSLGHYNTLAGVGGPA